MVSERILLSLSPVREYWRFLVALAVYARLIGQLSSWQRHMTRDRHGLVLSVRHRRYD
jgi:hypothetical protein